MKPRKPTELQLRILERVQAVQGGEYFYRFYTIHRSNQVTSRAVNLCLRHGWLKRIWLSDELRLTAAGRKALEAGKAVRP